MSAIEQARERYRPSEVRVLFVGESAPAGGTFFYLANSNLYFATKAAFEQGARDLLEKNFLASFQALGCYLDDLCPQPVNRLPNAQRRERWRAGEASLAERIRAVSPRAVVIVMAGIQENVRRALQQAGVTELPVYVLPFPARDEHKRRYMSELARIVAQLRAREIFLVPAPAPEPQRRRIFRRG